MANIRRTRIAHRRQLRLIVEQLLCRFNQPALLVCGQLHQDHRSVRNLTGERFTAKSFFVRSLSVIKAH